MEGKRKILKAARKRNVDSTSESNPKRKVSTNKSNPDKSVINKPCSSKNESKFRRPKVEKVEKQPLKREKPKHAVQSKSVDKKNLSALKQAEVKTVTQDFGLQLKNSSFKIPKKEKSLVKDSKLLTDSRLVESKDCASSRPLHASKLKDSIFPSSVTPSKFSNVNVVGFGGGVGVSSSSVPQLFPGSLSSTTPEQSNVVPVALFDSCEGMEWETTVQEIKNLWTKTDGSIQGSTFTPDGSSDAMEVDFIASSLECTNQLILIADTNIWIHCLSFLRELLDTKFPLYSYPLLVIPWMVLQELDVAGKSRSGPSRAAIHYIYKLLSTNHPRVVGQRASDACSNDSNFNRLIADDSILQCAQQQQHQKQGATVILLTNDRNMLNKALVNNILAADSSCGVKSVANLLASTNPNFNSLANLKAVQIEPKRQGDALKLSSSTTPVSWKATKRLRSPEKATDDEKKYKLLPNVLSTTNTLQTFADALELLRQTMAYIIETKMKEEYGEDGWLRALKISPPWTVESVIRCLIKHWIAVFTEVFGRGVSAAENLLDLIKRHKAGIIQDSKKAEDEIIEGALGLFANGEFAMSPLVKTDSKIRSCVQGLLAYQKTRRG